jgi:hypothetical protein
MTTDIHAYFFTVKDEGAQEPMIRSNHVMNDRKARAVNDRRRAAPSKQPDFSKRPESNPKQQNAKAQRRRPEAAREL